MRALTLPQRWRAGTGWSRPARGHVWAVLLAVAIALASFMHVAHTHDADVPASFQFCSFCVTFDRGGAPPPQISRAARALLRGREAALNRHARRTGAPIGAPPISRPEAAKQTSTTHAGGRLPAKNTRPLAAARSPAHGPPTLARPTENN